MPSDARLDARLDDMQIRITRLIDGFEERQHSRHLAIMRRVSEAEATATSQAAFINNTLDRLAYIVGRVERLLIEDQVETERRRDIESQAELPLHERRGVDLDWSDHPDFCGDAQPQRPGDCPPEAPVPGDRPGDCPPEAPPSTPSVCQQCDEPLSGSCHAVSIEGGIGHVHAGCADAWCANSERNVEHPDYVPF